MLFLYLFQIQTTMKFFSTISILLLLITSCTAPKKQADLIVTNANIYTVNDNFEKAQAIAVKNGKIIEVGSEVDVVHFYTSDSIIDAEGKTLLPGLIDAHAHLYNLGMAMQNVDLIGTESKDDVLATLQEFVSQKEVPFLYGRGWDQNDWEVQEFPTKEDLDSLFPELPVALSRVDGHALWVNSKALEMAGITAATKMEGGEVVLAKGEPSGILIDAPMKMVFNVMPKPSLELSSRALLEAEARCVSLGLTSLNDAGLDREIIELIDSLQQDGSMKLKVYAMVSNTEANLDHFLSKGIYKTDRLNVRSIKVYGDGALGSRGAALRAPYTDKHNHFGAMITAPEKLEALAQRIADAGYQMNTHAIGDSANVSVLRAYEKALAGKTDARWKVEHAQVVTMSDFDKFSKNIIPSVQPTHATSDMYWAIARLGLERIKGAYAYKTLLDKAGIIVLGTDFPVEKVNPMYTFYAAVARKDLMKYPKDGFQMKDALSREETLKGMTIWAAFSNFEENEKGSIEVGKAADFVILDTNIMECEVNDIPNTQVLVTYINGEKVFEKR